MHVCNLIFVNKQTKIQVINIYVLDMYLHLLSKGSGKRVLY